MMQQRTWSKSAHDALAQLRSEKYYGWVRLVFDLAVEIALIVVFLKAYNGVRNLFGSVQCTPAFALHHAQQVISVERALGFYWEQGVQTVSMRLGSHWIRFWNIFYGSAHMAVTIFVLGFLFVLQPAAYQRCRTSFILMNMIALAGYSYYPLMPPRLLNACDDPYGGCRPEFAFVDTMHTHGGLWSWRQPGVAKLSNHYAAMPSMHAGYSLWCALSMYRFAPPGLGFMRVLACIYPLLTIYCIVVTANHYLLDAVFGSLAWYVASRVAAYMPRFGRGADSRLAGLGGVTAAGDAKKGLLSLDDDDDELNGSNGSHHQSRRPLLPLAEVRLVVPGSGGKAGKEGGVGNGGQAVYAGELQLAPAVSQATMQQQQQQGNSGSFCVITLKSRQ